MKQPMTLTFARCLLFLSFLCSSANFEAQTIAEKRAGAIIPSGDLTPETAALLNRVNDELEIYQERLHALYREVQGLYASGASENEYYSLLEEIKSIKESIAAVESQWREAVAVPERGIGYSLWYQPETTVGQLINDYGSYSYIYVSPPDIAKIRVSVDSNIPIPRASWDEILEKILNQSGIAIRQLNTYLRELYWLDSDHSNLVLITNNREELKFFPPSAQVAFMLSPQPSEVKRIWLFLDRFVNSSTTALQIIDRDILMIGSIAEILDLLKIYDFASAHRGDREYKVLPVRKVDVEEMANILISIFDISSEPNIQKSSERRPSRDSSANQDGPVNSKRGGPPPSAQNPRRGAQEVISGGLRVIPLRDVAQAIFLVGTREEIRKAEEIVYQVESQVGDATARSIFWYHVKHSDPEELAQVLQKIYYLLVTTRSERADFLDDMAQIAASDPGALLPPPVIPPPPLQMGYQPAAYRGIYEEGYFLTDRFLVNPDPRSLPRMPANEGRENFLVDLKSGSIVMVVEVDLIPKLKELLKKLDVPKKMVQIEVMLFETVIERNNNMGLNLLQLGSLASNTNSTSLTYGAGISAASQAASFPTAPLLFDLVPINGITDFIISRKKSGGIPAYDAFYRFLISRDDIQINATPSVLTVNQTEATIEIEEEISVNTGIFVIQDAGVPTLKDSFARARYGIKITVVPTVHMSDKDSPLDNAVNYVTLDSEIKFETFVNNVQDRPDVTRRLVKNEARIADGQTVIIGGLRRKDSDDHKTAIPYLGEIPGIGKLFSQDLQHDRTTEMFIFMTPRIVTDPADELECLKMQEVSRRPGDIPSFLSTLVLAQEEERNRLFEGTISLLFGRERDRWVDDEGCLYDGR